jgi:hypothetical protein
MTVQRFINNEYDDYYYDDDDDDNNNNNSFIAVFTNSKENVTGKH